MTYPGNYNSPHPQIYNTPYYPAPEYSMGDRLKYPGASIAPQLPDLNWFKAVGDTLQYLLECERVRQHKEMAKDTDMEKLEAFVRGMVRQMVEDVK